jgi:hypothetical protein
VTTKSVSRPTQKNNKKLQLQFFTKNCTCSFLLFFCPLSQWPHNFLCLWGVRVISDYLLGASEVVVVVPHPLRDPSSTQFQGMCAFVFCCPAPPQAPNHKFLPRGPLQGMNNLGTNSEFLTINATLPHLYIYLYKCMCMYTLFSNGCSGGTTDGSDGWKGPARATHYW